MVIPIMIFCSFNRASPCFKYHAAVVTQKYVNFIIYRPYVVHRSICFLLQANSLDVKHNWVKQLRSLQQQFQFGLLRSRSKFFQDNIVVYNLQEALHCVKQKLVYTIKGN